MKVIDVLPDGLGEKLRKIIAGDDKDDKAKHENYADCKNHAEEMSWHVYGKKPEKLLKRSRPREDPEIAQYRLDCYEPITQSVCKKALSIVHKIFDPNLYAIHWDESEQSKVLKDYTTEYYPVFNSIVNYLANFILKKMMADPNGVILVQPYNYILKGSDRVKPIATSYHSRDVYFITPDYALLFDKLIKSDSPKSQDVWQFTYVDMTAIYKFNAYLSTNSRDIIIEDTAYYLHGFNEVPVWYLSGDYSDTKDGIFQSFFYAAVPFWNEAINDHSDVTGAYRMHLWPQKWEVADECEYVEEGEAGVRYNCQGGWINDGDGAPHVCPSCKGSGYKTIKSPYQSYLVNRDKFMDVQGNSARVEVPFGYVDVPVEATKMLEEKANKNLDKGLEALNMDVVNEIGLNQSGKAKEMDRTELNDFLKRISGVMYGVHMTNIMYFFTKYMFGITDPEKVEKIEPEISEPTQFDIYSTTELTDQFAKAKTANLNPSYLQVKQAEIQNKEFQTNPKLLTQLNLFLALDPLAGVVTDDVVLQLVNGTITKETAIIHDNIRVFVTKAMEENKNFESMALSEQRKILETYAKEVVTANKVKIDQTAIAPPIPAQFPPIK